MSGLQYATWLDSAEGMLSFAQDHVQTSLRAGLQVQDVGALARKHTDSPQRYIQRFLTQRKLSSCWHSASVNNSAT